MELRNYQKQGAEFLKNRKYALLADEIGTGKTVQAICALNGGARPVLIICPASVKLHWQNLFLTWRGEEAFIINSKDKTLPEAKILIVNYDLISREDKKIFNLLKKMQFSTVICDEAHRAKNPEAKRTKRILSKFGLIANTDRMWFLTGTPVHNRPIDLYTILSTCASELIRPYNDYMGFAFRYCGAFQDKFGLNVRGSSREKELNERIRPFYLRRRKEDVLDELPEKIVSKIEFDLSPHAKEIIRQEEQKTMEDAGESDPAYFKLGEIVRLRKCVAKYKVPEAVKFIEDLLEGTEKTVVFFHHHEVAQDLARHLEKYGVIIVSGKDNIYQKNDKIRAFNADPALKIFLGQMQACGEGVDGLQNAAKICVFVEPSWSPSDIDQAIGRLHRMGQKDPVVAYILTIKDTIESQMMDTILWKQKVIKKILGDEDKQRKGEAPMFLEERVAKLEQIAANCVNTIDKLTQLLDTPKEAPKFKSANPAVPPPTPRPVGRPAKAKAVQPAAEVSVEEVRELANTIVQEVPEGKNKCLEIVRRVGGGKLADCDREQLAQIKSEMQTLLSVGIGVSQGPSVDEI